MKSRFFKTTLLIITLLSGVKQSSAQSYFTSVSLWADSITCGDSCVELHAYPLSPAGSSYTVQQIQYTPPAAFDSGVAIPIYADDLWSGVINLPFVFSFYGNSYSHVIVSDNGVVSFDTTNANLYSNWSIAGVLPHNVSHDLQHSIMAPWQDMDATLQGKIYYQSIGIAPNREFIVSWYDMPMFGDQASSDPHFCSSYDAQTQMAVLYEGTNIIDIYIRQKDVLCTDESQGVYWNGDLAIEGLVNVFHTDTSFNCVPGRNATMWTAQNDAWRFTPVSPPPYIVNWFDSSTNIGAGDSVRVCALHDIYTATLSYDTGGVNFNLSNSISLPTPTLPIDSVVTIPANCSGTNGAIRLVISTGLGPFTYSWSNGEYGAEDTLLSVGNYWVTVSNVMGCYGHGSYSISEHATATYNFYDTICTGSSIPFNGSNINQAGIYTDSVSVHGCDSITIIYLTLVSSPLQSLCMVTADTASNKEVVIWDKGNKGPVNSYYIYRTTLPDTSFAILAAVNRDSLSEFTDSTSLPDSAAYRYKIDIEDTCGNFSTFSDYHQTIFLQSTGGGNFQWTPYLIENTPTPVNSYDFYRDSLGNGNWQLLASYPSSQTTATDANYALYPNARYLVQVILATSCNPSRSVDVVLSNILKKISSSGIEDITLRDVYVLNNPTQNELTFKNINSPVKLDLIDELGRVLQRDIEINSGNATLQLGNYAAGIYFVRLKSGSSSKTVKVVKF